MKTYFAIALGPLTDTIAQARKTRELWVASYLFSSLMKRIIEHLNNDKARVLSPIKGTKNKKDLYGAGVFPDKLYAAANGLTKEALHTLVNNCINALADDCLPKPSKKMLEKDGQQLAFNCLNHTGQAKTFWRNYFRVAIVWADIDEIADVLPTLNDLLDTAELQATYTDTNSAGETNYLLALLDYPYQTKLATALHHKSIYDGVMSNNSFFPSTAEIAALELFQRHQTAAKKALAYSEKQAETPEDDDLEQFYKTIYTDPVLKETAADYHKYYCIVHVDGDNFGETIKAVSSEEDIKDFSEKLANFAADAARLINDYGGKPVYIGGDDLLFFAPLRAVKNAGEATEKTLSIFHLLEKLDKEFDKKKISGSPSLSYGLTITYYKFPLFEARDLSAEQLFSKAKQFALKNGAKKNATSFRLLKHSGSYFEATFSKVQMQSLIAILEVIEALPGDLFSSIMFKLDTLAPLLDALAKEDGSLPEDRLEVLFDNLFKQKIHKDQVIHLATIRGLVSVIYDERATLKGKEIDPSRTLYALLRLLTFMSPKQLKSVDPLPTLTSQPPKGVAATRES